MTGDARVVGLGGFPMFCVHIPVTVVLLRVTVQVVCYVGVRDFGGFLLAEEETVESQ